jgi:hypothetical protein
MSLVSAAPVVTSGLGANTAFVFWPRPSGNAVPQSDSIFVGIARSWQAQKQCFGPTSFQ